MRDIKFRAKETLNNEWIYGYYAYYHGYEMQGEKDQYCIIRDEQECSCHNTFIQINPETLGQYTGLKDIKGKEIYEGDILQMYDRLVQVVWHEKAACWDCNFITYIYVPDTDFSLKGLGKTSWWKMYEVVGNIYDNKDILEGELKWGINHLSLQNKN